MALHDLAQAAAIIRSTDRWLADGVRNGRFPARRINRKLFFTDDDIEVIIEICSITPSGLSGDAVDSTAPSSMTKTTLRRMRQQGPSGRFRVGEPSRVRRTQAFETDAVSE